MRKAGVGPLSFYLEPRPWARAVGEAVCPRPSRILPAHNGVPESRARSEKREIADLRSSKSG